MKTRATLVLVAAAMIAACMSPSGKEKEAARRVEVIETVETDADRLLDYYAYVSGLQGDSLQREYHRVQKAFFVNPNEFNQMQLIMLLASPRATFRDTKYAHALIKAWLEDQYSMYSKLRPLALLYESYLSEVNRMDATLQQSSENLRQSGEQISRQREELAAEKQRTNALQRKLDALLEMEKNLIEREQPTSPERQ